MTVGKIRGVWGLRGDIRVEVLTDFPKRFDVGRIVYLEGRPAKVVRSRPAKKGLIIALDIVSNRTIAESLRGAELTIPSALLDPLPEGSYYHFQLIGLDVCTQEGENLGRVVDIITTAGNDVYVVSDDDERDEILVPALKENILSIDVSAKTMVVKLPELL